MTRRLILCISAIILALGILTVVPVDYAYANLGDPSNFIGGEDSVGEDIDDLQDDIEELEKKISNLQSQGKTLANEIAYFNSQISLTQLKIQNAIAEIAKRSKLLLQLVEDILDLEFRIDKLSASIDYQTNILNERMRARYKSQPSSPILIIFGSDTLQNVVRKAEYLKVMQLQDQELLGQMNDTKSAYTQQKDLFEEKKSQTEELKTKVESEKANLEVYKSNLDKQSEAKQVLLKSTQNDEAKYQEDLRKARAQLEAIQAIVASIDFKDGKEVEKGDVIAVMGNSGEPYCSTGAHLHLEIRKGGIIQNPEEYLKEKSVPTHDYGSWWDDSPPSKSIGSGSWSWPMKDPTISQRYGKTPGSDRYRPSRRHDGLDMVASDTFIYAPDDGIMVKGGMGCYGSVINYVAIDHGDDVVSYYLHVK